MENLDKDEKRTWMIVRVIVLAVAVLFTYFGFFNTQPCDLDAVYLSCRLNPFTVGDFIGCALFYSGCVVLAGVPALLGFQLWNPRNSSMWNIIFGVGAVLGVVLIWNT